MASGRFGDNPVQFVPYSVSRWHSESGLCPLVHLHTLPPLLLSLLPSQYSTPWPQSPVPAAHLTLVGQKSAAGRMGRKHTIPQGERRPCLSISGAVGSPGARGQKDGGGKPHLSLPLPLLPTLPFPLSHFKNCPPTPPYPQKHPPDSWLLTCHPHYFHW